MLAPGDEVEGESNPSAGALSASTVVPVVTKPDGDIWNKPHRMWSESSRVSSG